MITQLPRHAGLTIDAEIESALNAELQRCTDLTQTYPAEFAEIAVMAGWTLEQARIEYLKK